MAFLEVESANFLIVTQLFCGIFIKTAFISFSSDHALRKAWYFCPEIVSFKLLPHTSYQGSNHGDKVIVLLCWNLCTFPCLSCIVVSCFYLSLMSRFVISITPVSLFLSSNYLSFLVTPGCMIRLAYPLGWKLALLSPFNLKFMLTSSAQDYFSLLSMLFLMFFIC